MNGTIKGMCWLAVLVIMNSLFLTAMDWPWYVRVPEYVLSYLLATRMYEKRTLRQMWWRFKYGPQLKQPLVYNEDHCFVPVILPGERLVVLYNAGTGQPVKGYIKTPRLFFGGHTVRSITHWGNR